MYLLNTSGRKERQSLRISGRIADMLPTFPIGTADKRKNSRACKTLPKAAEQAEQRNKCAFCSVALRSALQHNSTKIEKRCLYDRI
nr:MAG TPA: hypothetical protein [Bacteriophage sp.]